MRDDPVNHLPTALVLMQLAGGVCFVVWWALKALVFENRRAGEPLGAPGARDEDAAPAPVQRPRQGPARPAGAGQASNSSQQGGARPRRRTASPPARGASQAPDDPGERSRVPSPTARRHSEAERLASGVNSAASNGSRGGTSLDGRRPARPAGATETPTPRRDPDPSRAAPLGRLPRRTEAPSQAAGQGSRAEQPDSWPPATLQAVGPHVLTTPRPRRADDHTEGDDDRFVMRGPRPGAAADILEADSAFRRAVIAEYEQRFRAREGEGWVQNPRDPTATPTPSTLRAERVRALTTWRAL
jgi:hypothetical protein